MKTRHGLGCCCIVVSMAWQLVAQESRPANQPPAMLVVLLPRASLPEPLVRVGDVADLQGGSAALRNQVAVLDLVELNSAQPTATLTKEQVYFRLRLAGLQEREFRMSGATRSAVQWDGAAAARDKLAPAANSGTPSPQQAIVVRPRDPVRLVSRIGFVEVTARGEAQDEARLGQIVRVRNVDSGKVVTGRLVQRNVVEVEH